KKNKKTKGFFLNGQQWQSLECILEYEDENKNMSFMARQLGISKSTFSKNIQFLVRHDLVEKYQQNDNRKDIILKPSERGRSFYKKRSQIISESGWKEPFAILDKLTDESMNILVEFMKNLVAEQEPENNKVRKLFKMQEKSFEK
ncbi:MAG: winged helix DNA-binding protein, partial [Treponema sp.]|nr:winged helix DNA-binding protein [Treponema sp.]